MARKAYFDGFKGPADFYQRFNANPATWESLREYLSGGSITMPTLSEADKEELNKRVKTWMARQIWGMPGYYEVSNMYDLTVKKARESNLTLTP